MVRRNAKETFRKGRIAQSWSALNLYNLAQFREPPTSQKTFFQQKWQAKSYTRPYHGNQVREKQWELQFSRKIPSVVEMDALSLAKDDGSAHAAGRGSGRVLPRHALFKPRQRSTPYMSMTYWPLERRLDTAIYRAMFASSVRMARQYVIHGHVKVNGHKLKYPGYQLNPGDMFSVDPELVMLGTGMRAGGAADKFLEQHPPPDAPQETKEKKGKVAWADEKEAKSDAEAAETSAPAENQEAESTEGDETAKEAPKEDKSMTAEKLKARLRDLDARIKEYSSSPLGKGYVFRTRRKNRLYKLRETRRAIKEAIKNAEDDKADVLKSLTRRVTKLEIPAEDPLQSHMQKVNPPPDPETQKSIEKLTHLELLKTWPNVKLQDKPYATPWAPRNWMSAFAFIPRYLEVNQNVCSAVYLRHPVARPGLAEVPSPFGQDMSMLAYQWYLRRR